MIKVEIKCFVHGMSYFKTVTLSKEEIEQLAMEKLKETDGSEQMEAIETSVELKA
jgi:hypothetical protein